jgi:hypothetical protein
MAKRVRYEFAWTDGSRISARFSPKVFGPIIVKYLKLYKQRLAAEKLLLEATPVGSQLHDIFDWDDTSAAHQHRLFQSRHLLRALDYKFKIKGGGELRGRATTISERNLQPGKYYYSMLKPAQVLKEAEDDCARSVEKIVSQLDRIAKRCPQILQECSSLGEAIEQMRGLKAEKKCC